MIMPNINNLTGYQCSEKHFKYHYPEFLQYLNNNYPNITFQEKLYWYYHNLKEQPKCETCGGKTKFINTREGYRKFCSRKCLNNNEAKKEKSKQTCLEKYGVEHLSQSEQIRNRSKQTCLERYGVENPMQNQEIKNKSKNTNINRYGGCGHASQNLKNKYNQTCLERYGVENPMQNQEIKEILKNSILNKYGVEHISHLKKIKAKIQQSRREIEMLKHPFIINYTNNNEWICKCPHEGCDKCEEKKFIISPLMYECRMRDKTEICTNLLPIGKDRTKNTTIELFIQNILDENNIVYETNSRNIISPKELDIYIPSKNIAIECNGIYSHSSKYKDPNYHIEKYKNCKEKGIQLISIWEDWVRNKPEIVKSIILSKLGLINKSIYARKCVIKEIPIDICNNFLNENHIQGKSNSSVKLGLYYNNELVSVMAFCRKRGDVGGKEYKHKKDVWELSRFCNKINTNIVGAASKLLKYFIKTYDPKSIISFSMNDISNGSLYETLGFIGGEQITNSYWYIDRNNIRYHRNDFSKDSILAKGLAPNNDKSTWTEFEVMEKLGFLRIHY